MIERSPAAPIAELCFPGKKMAFVSRPRQCGNTTLVVETPDYARQLRIGEESVLVASASRVLDCLL